MTFLFFFFSLASPLFAAADAQLELDRAGALYYKGEHEAALEHYQRAAKLSTDSATGWLNGGVILEEAGQPKKAASWYERAVALSSDAASLNALGWAQWRARDLPAASSTFARALNLEPDHPTLLLGAARVMLDTSRPREALDFLDRAAAAAPLLNLVAYYEGVAYENMRDPDRSIAAYRRAVLADSYFNEGRDFLARAYLRQRSYNEAWAQWARALDAEPHNKRLKGLLQKVQYLLTRSPGDIRRALQRPPPPPLVAEAGAVQDQVPVIRVGIGTNPLGKPRARQNISFKVNAGFEILDAASKTRLLAGNPDETWSVRLKRRKKMSPLLILVDPSGKAALQRKGAVVIHPNPDSKSVISLDETINANLVRGELEIAAWHSTLRLVNIVDLENYTNGVVSMEMPIRSPLEALKAQAVMARSHALYIKKFIRRHAKEGYDVCNEQHCQVYGGVRAESARSRDVVEATRGHVVTYNGKIAYMLYCSNCGGHTQSGNEVTGWGDVPYWKGVPDGSDSAPRSPWELKQWLTSRPKAFCSASDYVHPSHYRWNRVVAFKDLEEKISHKLKTGKLLSLRPLRRSPSGNVNVLLITGSRRKVRINSEMQIRGLLGIGSLRSTLFVMETEYNNDHKPATLVFYGGGWGHGVGLCQSGAMGRAEAGQDYAAIISAYFPGTQLARLVY